MKPVFDISILGAILSFLSVASYAQTPISSLPYTITAPGNYILSKSLAYSGASGNAITVNTSNVTINFNGFYIVCPTGNNEAFGVYAYAQNHVTVKNGEIIGFSEGVEFDSGILGSLLERLYGNDVANSANLVDAVCFIRNTIAVVCFQSTACVIQNCQIVGGSHGVRFLKGTGNRATNNVANGQSTEGFFSDGTDYFDSNYADHCSTGFDALSSTTKLRFNTTTNCTKGVNGGTSEYYLDQ